MEVCRVSLEVMCNTGTTMYGVAESESRDGLTRPRHTSTDSLLASGGCGVAGRYCEEGGRAFGDGGGGVAEAGCVLREGSCAFRLGGGVVTLARWVSEEVVWLFP